MSIKAILYGVLADVVGTTVFGLVLGIIFGMMLATSGKSPAEIEAMFMQSNLILFISLVGGLAFTWVGGQVAGRVAEEKEVMHAGIVGAIGVVLTLLLAKNYPGWFVVGAVLLSIPVAISGGRSAVKKKSVLATT